LSGVRIPRVSLRNEERKAGKFKASRSFYAIFTVGKSKQKLMIFNVRNASAKKYERVRKGFYFTLTAGEVLLGAIAVAGMFFPAQLVAVFQNDPEVVAIGGIARRVQLVALFFQPMTVCANMMFQSIWKNGRATLLAMLRNLMYYSEKRLTVPA
jgi:Na+-driven multidrug efflux pump